MNRHPLILESLGKMLPPGGRRPETRLLEDLRVNELGKEGLVQSIEEAWRVTLSPRAVAEWKTLDDVVASIADAMALQPA